MKRPGSVRWHDIVLPDAAGRGGIIHATVTYRRPAVEVVLEAQTEHHGWPITARDRTGRWPDIVAGLVSATFRWSGSEGPDLVLTWRLMADAEDRAVQRYAEVSDVYLLLTDKRARAAVLALYGDLPSLGSGRPSEQAGRVAAIIAAAAEMGTGATREAVAQRLGRVADFGELRSDYKRDVRAAGGWPAIMRQAAQAEF